MKKFFTFLAMAAVTVSAFALRPLEQQMANARMDLITPEAKHAMKMNAEQIKASIALGENIPGTMAQRTYNDGKVTWTLRVLMNTQKWCEIIPFVNPDDPDNPDAAIYYTFEEFPWYLVNYIISGVNNSNTSGSPDFYYAWNLMWPCMTYWKYIPDLAKEQGKTLTEVIKSMSEVPDYSAVDVTDMASMSADYCATFKEGYRNEEQGVEINPVINAQGNNYANWIAVNNYMFYSEGEYAFYNNGLPAMTYVDNTITSMLRFSGWDADTEVIDSRCQARVETLNTNGNVSKSSKTVSYKGTAVFEGFHPRDINIELANFHIFNFGNYSNSEDGSQGGGNVYDNDFKDVTRFYVMGTNDKFRVGYTGSGEDLKVGFDYLDPNTPTSTDELCFLRGALFMPAGSTDPHGSYTFIPEDYRTITIGDGEFIADFRVPEAYGYIVYFSDEGYSAQDGLAVANMGDYVPMYDDTTALNFGGSEGLLYQGQDAYGNNVKVMFQDMCKYHPNIDDPSIEEDMPAKTAVNEIFGEVAPLNITAANGVISVKAAEDAEVVVYNVAGALVNAAPAVAGETVSFNVDGGLYIVKVGKQAQKVVL